MNAVNWFEIPTNDLSRAKQFYESLLNIELSLNEMGPMQMAWFPMNPDAPGATGTLVKAEGYSPSHQGSLVYFHTEDIENALKTLESHGGKTLMPKTSIGEYGFIAHFEDSEGNRIALHSHA